MTKSTRPTPTGKIRQASKGGPPSVTDLRPFFEFMYATDCRFGAVQKIRWEHVSKDCSEIKIPGATRRTVFRSRFLAGPILEPIAAKLRKRFRDDKPVFDSTNYRPEWARACAKAAVGTWDEKTRTRTGVRIHDCRCSGAVNLIDSNVNEGLVLKIGGWKTRKMLDRYNVTNRKRLAAALGQSGEYVAERMNGTK